MIFLLLSFFISSHPVFSSYPYPQNPLFSEGNPASTLFDKRYEIGFSPSIPLKDFSTLRVFISDYITSPLAGNVSFKCYSKDFLCRNSFSHAFYGALSYGEKITNIFLGGGIGVLYINNQRNKNIFPGIGIISKISNFKLSTSFFKDIETRNFFTGFGFSFSYSMISIYGDITYLEDVILSPKIEVRTFDWFLVSFLYSTNFRETKILLFSFALTAPKIYIGLGFDAKNLIIAPYLSIILSDILNF